MPAHPLLPDQLLCFQQYLSAENEQADPLIFVSHARDFQRMALWDKVTVEERGERLANRLGILLVLPLTDGREGYCTVDAWFRMKAEYIVRYFSNAQFDFVAYTYRDGTACDALKTFCRAIMDDTRLD